MEILRPLSTPMPTSSHQRIDDEELSLPSSPSPAASHSPISSPPSSLMNASITVPSIDCGCSDFWFGSEDSMQTKIIHSLYMNTFDLSTTRKHASRAPIAFIGLILRRQITKQFYYQIMQSTDVILTKHQHPNNDNNKINQKKNPPSSVDDHRSKCCKSNESPTHCESCRLYTIDEISINQRDCVPLGFTMKKIQSSIVVTIWDNYDGLPLHQHRLRRWPQEIINKQLIQPHSYIECNPLYDDDPTGLHCTDASFVYSTHLYHKTICTGVEKGGDGRGPTGYASMNQPCILDALRRLGRPSDAEGVRQLNATGQEGAESDNNEHHPAVNDDDETEKQRNNNSENKNDRSTENENDDEEESDHDDHHEDQSASDDEDNHENDDVDDDEENTPSSSLPSSNKPNSLRRHHTEGSSIPSGACRRSKSLRSKSDDEADEAAKLMAKLGLGSYSINCNQSKKNNNNCLYTMEKNTRNKFSGSTDAESDDCDDDIDEEYFSDDDHFSSQYLDVCDHGWK